MVHNFPLSFFHFPFRKRSAFTLIELLMVVAILGLVMVAITQLLARVISSSGKSAATQSVKENGQFAITTMEKTIRKAKSITTCSGFVSGTLTIVVDEGGTDVTYTFTRVDIGGGKGKLTKTRTPSGGSAVTSDLSDSNLSVGSFSCGLAAATATAPPSVAMTLIIGNQTFTSQVSPRVY